MGSWYSIGLVRGLAVGGGVIAAGALARSLAGMMVGAVAAAAVGVALGIAAGGALPPVGGGVGGVVGVLGASQGFRGALRRGGTDAGPAALVRVARVVLAGPPLLPGPRHVPGGSLAPLWRSGPRR